MAIVAEPASQPADTLTGEQTYYEAGGGRKAFFALTFLILLPFFVSLPFMIGQRVIKGVWLDTWGLMVIAVLFTAIMMLILFELIFSLRSKVDIGQRAVAFTLPSAGGGMTPLVSYRSRVLRYEDIAGVETFREVYGGAWAPVMMIGVRVVLKDGERVLLGFVNEADDDPRFPFRRIGHQIAGRAGVDVVDRGSMLAEFNMRMFGVASVGGGASVPEEEIAELNRKHKLFLTGLIAFMMVLLVLGIGNDAWRATIDSGERAVTEKIRVR